MSQVSRGERGGRALPSNRVEGQTLALDPAGVEVDVDLRPRALGTPPPSWATGEGPAHTPHGQKRPPIRARCAKGARSAVRGPDGEG
jgi:hypothetical protein